MYIYNSLPSHLEIFIISLLSKHYFKALPVGDPSAFNMYFTVHLIASMRATNLIQTTQSRKRMSLCRNTGFDYKNRVQTYTHVLTVSWEFHTLDSALAVGVAITGL